MGPPPLVEGKELQYVRLYKERERAQRLDVLPFLFAYGAWIFFKSKEAFTASAGAEEGAANRFSFLSIIGAVLVGLHILLYLFTIWSVDVKCFVKYAQVNSLSEATHVKVVPHAFTGTKEIIPIEKHVVDGHPAISFSFRKLRFIWEADDQVFRKLRFPTDLTFSDYRKTTGHGKDAAVAIALERWGLNRFEVPMPQFWELLKEQLVAPFFCFQVFCVALWALDEYWYYSVMTLFMLVTFESTVVHQRQRNLKAVLALQQPRQPLRVYRGGKWAELPGEVLVPGDLVSLARPPASTDDVIVQADMLLLAGTCIVDEAVLTGESIPQWKNPIGEATGDEVDSSELSPSARLSMKRDRMHIVFGGTKLLQATPDKEAHVRTTDQGSLAVVLRTGFGTAQGRLMRTILYSTERVTANNMETFGFILFLLVWAVLAAYYVLKEGLADPDRDRFKLLLNCIMILTSVVPPELPMELTIAVNTSLVALARKKVFCTEPFRIPLAGKVTTCCFDKTGTLTSDHMELEGVVGGEQADGSDANGDELCNVRVLPAVVSRVLACCQSLVQVSGSVVGDPVETAALQATGWSVRGDTVGGPTAGGGKESATILHRFHFSSVLKRMSTVVEVKSTAGGAGSSAASPSSFWVLMKGAPEEVERHLVAVPPRYGQQYKRYASEGARVLAMAYKRLPDDTTLSALRHTPRDEAESGLTFTGFAVFRSPLKPDSEPSLRMLRASLHQLVMITGDAPLTACHTAAQVHIVTRQPMVLSAAGPPSAWVWRSPDETLSEPFDVDSTAAAFFAEAYDLCLTGAALQRLPEAGPDAQAVYVCLTSVFARVTPEQKELVVKTLRAAGLSVLMCGDGTNDVGALKGAHVGVALLPPPEKRQAADAREPAGAAAGGRGGKKVLTAGGSGGGGGREEEELTEDGVRLGGPGAKMLDDLRRRGAPVTAFHRRMAKMMDDMAGPGGGDGSGEPPIVRPGDASMAAPFTAKESSVAPCLDILRQGRCTLVTTVQMFKILGLLSLSMAYSLSVLYLDGIKLGDLQATLAGLLTAGMFFFISNAQPLDKLSRERPHPHIFSMYVFSSLLGQFAVHMTFLMFLQKTAHEVMEADDRQLPDAEFKPNLINTVCFLANFAIQTMTFAVNYVGEPFATPLLKNRMFAGSVRFSVVMYALLSLDIVAGLCDWFSLVALPPTLRMQMVGLALAAFMACTAIERGARAAFPAKQPPEKGGLRAVPRRRS